MLRRIALPLALLALCVACDGITDPVTSPQTTGPAFAATRHSVDPGALTPAPPPEIQAECRADGQSIICHTRLVIESENTPVFDLTCGTVYETSRDVRLGIRRYDASDSVIVSRQVRQDVEGTWSLSPDGTGPSANLAAHANWYDSQYTDPTDLESGVASYHGEITVGAPGFGAIAHIAGLDRPDGSHNGVVRSLDDPAVVAKLCAALTR